MFAFFGSASSSSTYAPTPLQDDWEDVTPSAPAPKGIPAQTSAVAASILAKDQQPQIDPAKVDLKTKNFCFSLPVAPKGLLDKTRALFKRLLSKPVDEPNPIALLKQEADKLSTLESQIAFLDTRLGTAQESAKWGIHYLRGQYRIKQGDSDGALNDIEASLVRNPTPQADYLKANLLAFRNNTPELAEAYFILHNLLLQGAKSELFIKAITDQDKILALLLQKANQNYETLSLEEICILTAQSKGHASKLVLRLYNEEKELARLSSSFLRVVINHINKEIPKKDHNTHFALGILYKETLQALLSEIDEGYDAEDLDTLIQQIKNKLIENFTAAINKNCAKSKRELGIFASSSYYASYDIHESLDLLTAAAAQNDVPALLILASDVTTDPFVAAAYLIRAHQNGNSDQRRRAEAKQKEWKLNSQGDEYAFMARMEMQRLLKKEKAERELRRKAESERETDQAIREFENINMNADL